MARAPGWVKAPFRVLLERLDLYSSYKLRTDSFLREVGWFRSFREQVPQGLDGRPVPWITYGAIEFLDRRLRRELSVFEFGTGASTWWWADRVARLVSCEHDPAWGARLRGRLPAHVELLEKPLEAGEYARAVAGYPEAFEIVVIDGRERVACAREALEGLKPEGVIVWDDTDRAEYEPGFAFLHGRGFRRIEFGGLAPTKCHRCETSVFYRDRNCLGI
jgi:hypothetical protein